jgi:hypothetical protein
MTVTDLRKLLEIGEALGQGDSTVCYRDRGESCSEQYEAQADFVDNGDQANLQGKYVLEITVCNL